MGRSNGHMQDKRLSVAGLHVQRRPAESVRDERLRLRDRTNAPRQNSCRRNHMEHDLYGEMVQGFIVRPLMTQSGDYPAKIYCPREEQQK